MISNIFGLHIGCKVKLDNSKVFKIDGVHYGKSSLRPMVRCNDEDLSLYIDYCKLLLKPLSTMSDEDKAEFEKEFNEANIKHFETTEYENVIYFIQGNIFDEVKECNFKKILWLCSKGYDVGIVPDEYKEVIE